MECVQSYLIILVEMSCFLLLFDIFSKLEYRFSKLFYLIWIALISAIINGVSHLLADFFFLKAMVNILCITFGSLALKRIQIKKAFFSSVFFMFLLLLSDLVTLTLDKKIISVDVGGNEHILNMLVILMSKMVLLVLIVIAGYVIDARKYTHDEIEYNRFVLFPLMSICIIAVLKSNGFGSDDVHERYFVWCIIFCLIAMNVLMVFYMRDITEKHHLLQERRMFEMDARNQQILYRTLEEKIELQRSISHDYKNHLSYIQGLLERGDDRGISEYLKKINGEVDRDLDRIDTNNPVVNVVVNTKYYEAKKAGAVIVCKINDLSDVKMKETDIILLLSNLLNNAIEAIKHCTNEKILRFKIVAENGNFVISMQNSYSGELRKNGEIYITTKTKNQEMHGIGLKNITRIVDKYNGIYQFAHTGEEFHATIIIPNNKSSVC
jgi:sensor histidine kinase YesM